MFYGSVIRKTTRLLDSGFQEDDTGFNVIALFIGFAKPQCNHFVYKIDIVVVK